MVNNTGIIFVTFTYNNMIVTLTSLYGQPIFQRSAGKYKTKGLKKSVGSTFQTSINEFIKLLYIHRLKNVYIKFRGISKFKKHLLRRLSEQDLSVKSITDITCISHNGCKLSRKRCV